MSQRLISHNSDLKRLRDEGYDVALRGAYLLLRGVPYVTSKKEVALGTLVSELNLAGDETITPKNHVAQLVGEYPCNADGTEIARIRHQSGKKTLDKDLVIDHSFSSKPTGGYRDHYEKMTTYVAILSSPAQSLDPTVTAKSFPVVEPDTDEDSVFNYLDTASSRAEITAVTRKLELQKVAILGVGGTGSYVLDLVAKTPVREIHLFDGDMFAQHNAFRSPGAPSAEDLRRQLKKAVYHAERYAPMRRGIVPHTYDLDESNAAELCAMQFVFLCADGGGSKQALLEKLGEFNVPFVDVGMGVDHNDGSLGGVLRVTTSTNGKRDHLARRISAAGAGATNEYARNIQIADLNALNAALAVIKWKKLFGFYRDLEHEHHSTYTLDGNTLTNEEQP